MFAAMAALLVAALCAPPRPSATTPSRLRASATASCGSPRSLCTCSRRRTDHESAAPSWACAVSTTIGVGDHPRRRVPLPTGWREALWILALVLDFGGPAVFGISGWKLSPAHFAERHGLVIIIALGESIVALGIVVEVDLTAGVVTAAVLGVALASALWWTYFDVVALAPAAACAGTGGRSADASVARLLLLPAPPNGGRHRARRARLGVDDRARGRAAQDRPGLRPARAGPALYYLAHVAFRWRNRHTLAPRRILTAALLLAFFPLAHEIDALLALAVVAAVEMILLLYELIRFRDARASFYAKTP